MDVDDKKGQFRHTGVSKSFGLEGKAGSGTAGHGKVAGIGSPEGNGDRGKLIFGLDEDAAILWKFAAQQFHDA